MIGNVTVEGQTFHREVGESEGSALVFGSKDGKSVWVVVGIWKAEQVWGSSLMDRPFPTMISSTTDEGAKGAKLSRAALSHDDVNIHIYGERDNDKDKDLKGTKN